MAQEPKLIDSEWLKQKYCEEKLSCPEIAKLSDIEISRQAIWKKIKNLNIKIRSRKDGILNIDGKRSVLSQGYVWHWEPSHPRANNGYVKRCVLNLEKKLNRPLAPKEMVHHIDGDRLNDDLDNLEVTNRSDHMKLHMPIIDRWRKVKPPAPSAGGID